MIYAPTAELREREREGERERDSKSPILLLLLKKDGQLSFESYLGI